PCNRGRIGGVGAEAIDGLGRERDQPAVGENARGRTHGGLAGGQNLGCQAHIHWVWRPSFGFLRCAKPKAISRVLVGVWLSPVEHCVRDAGVAGSNPATPTRYHWTFCSDCCWFPSQPQIQPRKRILLFDQLPSPPSGRKSGCL